MALLVKCRPEDFPVWQRELKACGLKHAIRHWSDPGPVEEIEYAFVWAPEPGVLAQFPNLKVVFSLAIGVDHILTDPLLPEVPVVRLVARETTARMAEYVLLSALYLQRGWDRFAQPQPEQLRWSAYSDKLASDTTVGILGMGAVGRQAASALKAVGFKVRGWSRTERRADGIATFHGNAQLPSFLAETEILVCVLPLTAQTQSIVNAELLSQLPQGASLVNAGRGQHLVEEDLLAAMESGHIRSAVLDVFHQEPLPAQHPFWAQPRITITPHCAGLASYAERARALARNIERYESGTPMLHVADRHSGY